MKVAIVLPRGMRFSPKGATSIDIVAHDLLRHSKYNATTYVIGGLVEEPFEDVDFRPVNVRSQSDFVPKSLSILRADLPDVIVVHQHAESANLIARALPKTPVILHRHGLLRHKKGFLSRWRKGRQLKNLAHIVFVSEFLRRRFLEDHPGYEDKTSVVYNGIDPDFWRLSEVKENIVAFVGRAREDKGVLQVVEAFKELKNTDWRLELVLAVQTLEERQLADQIHKLCLDDGRISIQENLPHTGVRDALAKSKIVAVPSLVEEGFHRVIIEALACGCEVVASKRGGALEAGGDQAQYLDPNQRSGVSSQVASALKSLMKSDDSSALEAREWVVERFTLTQVAQSYDAILAKHTGSQKVL